MWSPTSLKSQIMGNCPLKMNIVRKDTIYFVRCLSQLPTT